MSKPVEIEFLMKDNLSGGLDKAGQSVQVLADRAKAAAEAINVKISEQHKVIDGVAADLDRMERQLAGMKPGTAQRELAADVAACRKVLDEERGTLAELEKQHRQAEKAVNELAKEYDKLAGSGEKAAVSQLSLAERIAESKSLIKGTQADIRELEKSYRNAAPGNAQAAVLAELNAAKKALEEEKAILASLTAEQDRNKESNKRLSMQLRELQDAMARMRLEGRQDSEEYRKMAAEAANLSDTIADLHAQTKILSNDDANLHGFMSGVSGLSGMFTAATGALSLFASENENLAKVQARVQSVMAVTMGLQQVFNTLNKDSAFRLVTVTKVKNLLTAANTRLAVSLGISTVAAQALMATLTFGLSAVITGLIVLWNKFSDAQEEASRKAQEMVEIESEGRAQMIRTRFEINNTISSLKNFSGSKEEEKKKTEELNRKYGEAFGYYDTVAEWYDILTQKSSDYIQMLFLQAKAQAMVNKAIEADEKLNKLKATSQDDVEGSMGWFRKSLMYFAQSSEPSVQFDAQHAIDEYNKAAKDKALADAQAEVDSYLKQAEELTRQAAQIGKENNIGSHKKPDTPKNPTGGNGDPQKEYERKMAAERQLAQELLQLRRENDAAEIEVMDEGLQKKLRQIAGDYQARKNEIDRQESDWKRKNKEAGRGEDLSAEQQSAIDRSNELNAAKRQKAVAEAYREEFSAMQENLRTYGTYQQQKLAITEEYAEKIRKASSEREKRYLGIERDSLLAGVEAQELKANIDWSVVFGEFGGMFHDLIVPELEKAKVYMQTDEFRNADHESQEALINAIRQMEESLGGANKVSFKKLGAEITAYQKSLSDLKKAQDDYESTYADLSKAQRDYIRAVESGTKEEQDIARTALDTAQANADAAAENVASMQVAASEAQRTMTDTATTLKSSMDGVVDGLRQIASGSLSGAYEGLIKFGNSAEKMGGKLGAAFGKMADALEDVPIIGWIVSIIDLFKDGLSVVVGGLLDAVFNAVSGILSDVLSGDLFVTIGKSIYEGIGNIFDALTFGGWSSWTTSSNAKEVQETIDRLTDRNETLQTAIEDLTDEIKASKGTKSVAAYRDAYKYQQETNANYLQMAQAQAGYHGSHHSWNYYWGGFSQAQIDKLSSQIGRQWNGDIWNLSPEEMKMLRSNVDMWTQLQNSGKGGYGGRLADKLDDYIDQAGKLEELTDQLYEGLTGISFDGMYGSFIDNLMDMKYDAKAAAEDISEYFMRAMLSNKIGELYSDKLKEWWEKFGKAMEDNDLTEAERKALSDEYMKYVDEAIKLRDNLAAATGYAPDGDGGTSQKAKAGGFSAMTQDQGTKLEGMFTSGLQHWSSMDDKMENVSEKMNSAESHLAKIEENTGKSAEHLEKIAENMLKIIRDGLKVK